MAPFSNETLAEIEKLVARTQLSKRNEPFQDNDGSKPKKDDSSSALSASTSPLSENDESSDFEMSTSNDDPGLQRSNSQTKSSSRSKQRRLNSKPRAHRYTRSLQRPAVRSGTFQRQGIFRNTLLLPPTKELVPGGRSWAAQGRGSSSDLLGELDSDVEESSSRQTISDDDSEEKPAFRRSKSDPTLCDFEIDLLDAPRRSRSKKGDSSGGEIRRRRGKKNAFFKSLDTRDARQTSENSSSMRNISDDGSGMKPAFRRSKSDPRLCDFDIDLLCDFDIDLIDDPQRSRSKKGDSSGGDTQKLSSKKNLCAENVDSRVAPQTDKRSTKQNISEHDFGKKPSFQRSKSDPALCDFDIDLIDDPRKSRSNKSGSSDAKKPSSKKILFVESGVASRTDKRKTKQSIPDNNSETKPAFRRSKSDPRLCDVDLLMDPRKRRSKKGDNSGSDNQKLNSKKNSLIDNVESRVAPRTSKSSKKQNISDDDPEDKPTIRKSRSNPTLSDLNIDMLVEPRRNRSKKNSGGDTQKLGIKKNLLVENADSCVASRTEQNISDDNPEKKRTIRKSRSNPTLFDLNVLDDPCRNRSKTGDSTQKLSSSKNNVFGGIVDTWDAIRTSKVRNYRKIMDDGCEEKPTIRKSTSNALSFFT